MPIANLPGDLQMHYYDDDFTDPWTEPEVVIFQHGQAKNANLWYAWVPLLARDYRVIRVDGRGFGESSVPRPGAYKWSMEGFASDIANLMDALDIEKAHIVGETVGGAFAIQFAYQFPERTRTLTVCQAPYVFRGNPQYMQYHDTVRDHGVAGWVKESAGRRLTPGKVPQGHIDWYVEQMCRTQPHVIMETLAAIKDVDLRPQIARIKAPTLSLAGALGDSAERMRELADLLPNGRFVSIPGVSGFVQHEAPAECAAAWRDFVKSTS